MTVTTGIQCTHCGGTAWRIDTEPFTKRPDGRWYRRYCRDCGAAGPNLWQGDKPFKGSFGRNYPDQEETPAPRSPAPTKETTVEEKAIAAAAPPAWSPYATVAASLESN